MRAALLTGLILLGGCATTGRGPAPVARLGQEFQLRPGDFIWLQDGVHLLKFDRVAEDSRCAAGVACVWEGNARILVEMAQVDVLANDPSLPRRGPDLYLFSDETSFTLNTSTRFPTRSSALGYTVELRRLEPAPRADTPIQGYEATLVVTKGQAKP
jgi:hypothetical protein